MFSYEFCENSKNTFFLQIRPVSASQSNYIETRQLNMIQLLVNRRLIYVTFLKMITTKKTELLLTAENNIPAEVYSETCKTSKMQLFFEKS